MSTPNRRRFLVGAVSALPAAAWLSACGEADGSEHDFEEQEPLASETEPLQRRAGEARCVVSERDVAQRLRLRDLLDRHIGEQNQHDLPGILGTYSEHAELVLNHVASARGRAAIADVQVAFGLSDRPGGLAASQVVPLREHYTDDEVLIEGQVLAEHVGDLGGLKGTGQRVSLPYAAFYRFDRAGELVSQRVVMDFTPLAHF